MAERATGKPLKQLKIERAMEKRKFTCLVNAISRTYNEMTAEDLQDSLQRLTEQAEKVMETNDDLEAGIIAESEAELEEGKMAALTELQKADIERTAGECEVKLKEIKSLLQDTFWVKYGSKELSTALQVAEAESERVAAVVPDGNHEAYDFMLKHLQTLAKTAKDLYSQWQRCIPPSDQNSFRQGLSNLDLNITRSVSRKADFIRARREEDAVRTALPSITSSNPVATIRLNPISLPKFTGNKRDFYRWKRDWEALQTGFCAFFWINSSRRCVKG